MTDAGLVLRSFDADEEAVLQALLESDSGYTERVTGLPPGPSDALSLLLGRPEALSEDDKLVLGAWDGDQLVGVVDLLLRYPDEQTVFIGLLLVHGQRQGEGLGRAVLTAVERWAGSWGWARRMRLAVVRTNSGVSGFWEHLGYAPTGEVRPYRYAGLESESVLYDKPVGDDRAAGGASG